MKIYTLERKFIEKTNDRPPNFTGIVEWPDGAKDWFSEGKLHRLDGPACEWSNGTKEWRVNNKRHRLDGPACEWSNGTKEWWVDNKQVTEEQCKLLYSIMKLKGLI